MVKRRRKLDAYFVPSAIIAIIIGLLIFISQYGSEFGFTSAMTSDIIAVIPSIFLLLISFWVIISMRSPLFVIGGFGVLGIGTAYLMKTLYDLSIVTGAMLGGATIEATMLITFIVCILIGGVTAVGFKK